MDENFSWTYDSHEIWETFSQNEANNIPIQRTQNNISQKVQKQIFPVQPTLEEKTNIHPSYQEIIHLWVKFTRELSESRDLSQHCHIIKVEQSNGNILRFEVMDYSFYHETPNIQDVLERLLSINKYSTPWFLENYITLWNNSYFIKNGMLEKIPELEKTSSIYNPRTLFSGNPVKVEYIDGEKRLIQYNKDVGVFSTIWNLPKNTQTYIAYQDENHEDIPKNVLLYEVSHRNGQFNKYIEVEVWVMMWNILYVLKDEYKFHYKTTQQAKDKYDTRVPVEGKKAKRSRDDYRSYNFQESVWQIVPRKNLKNTCLQIIWRGKKAISVYELVNTPSLWQEYFEPSM